MNLRFLLNGGPVEVDVAPTVTLLDWLRETRGLTGTKEGCNEGDCGACSVIVTDDDGARTLNACILLMGQLDGSAVRTVEGLAGPDGCLHPVQKAMIDHHGSQCGFCTPGFVVTMACAHLNGRRDHDVQLAGNLCRCTGYAPIVRAAEAAEGAPVPAWMYDNPPTATAGETATAEAGPTPSHANVKADWGHRDSEPGTGASSRGGRRADASAAFRPRSSDELAAWYAEHPDATLIAGATDVGLWVTKGLRDLGNVAFLNGCADLSGIDIGDDRVRIGAATTLTALGAVMEDLHPSFAALIRCFGSVQVRNAATVGGNIANGSPIGDGPPALIALSATLHLRRGDERRAIALEDFFLEYGKQDLELGEFVEAVSFPRQSDNLRCWKVSKRFDQDISALCGCFNARTDKHHALRDVRIAFGGMAGTPKRARRTEAALEGRPGRTALDAAQAALADDFAPLSDMRASALYRLEAGRGLLERFVAGEEWFDLREVMP